jgi:hypothetical protein
MISIPRSVLRTFRSLVRRARLHKGQPTEPCLSLIAGPEGCRIQAASLEVAIEYCHPGQFEPETILLPVKALDAWGGRGNEPVTLEQQPEHCVLASWSDRGVPRQATFRVAAKAAVNFPERPSSFASSEPELWPALRNAVATVDRCPTRYALNCLHLRGLLGRIDATDGRQILSQAGYNLGFVDDLLVSASPVLGCRELETGEAVGIGRAGDWIGFSVGNWLIMLRIDKAGRFPQIDDIMPQPELAKSRLELSPADASFLSDVLPRLPCDDSRHDPVTIDLNGRVLIRSRESSESRTTEVELTNSQLVGEPIKFCLNRHFIERAVSLGFRQVHAYGQSLPVLCQDDRRRYLSALLDPENVLPASDDPIRIESPGPQARPSRNPRPKEKSMTTTTPVEAQPTTTKAARAKRPRAATTSSPIEQAIFLRDALAVAVRQANELARTLKHQRRHERVLASTLSQLKLLQKAAG